MVQKLLRDKLLLLFTAIQITTVICEETVFKIRKCCAENELILEKTNECTDFKLLRLDNHIYHHENESESINPTGLKNPRPWWFPPNKNIMSKKTNRSIDGFPEKMEVIAGKGQPCDIFETALLPIYLSRYDFFEDGSLIVYPNEKSGIHIQNAEIIFEPMSYCIDRLELDTDNNMETKEPTIDLIDSVEYLIMLCPCKKATCILKCCPPGMLIDVESTQDRESACIGNDPAEDDWKPNYTKVGSDSRDYFLLHHLPICKSKEEPVLPNQFKEDGHTIYSDGTAHIFGETHVNQPFEFCGDNFVYDRGDKKVYNHLIRCYPKVGIKYINRERRRTLYGILFVFGAFFLFLTLLVHGLLPTRNNINDKNLISQTWSLFVGYVCTAVSQLAIKVIPQNGCIFLGFLIQYSFLAAFFWLNVLCFDISWTFSELRIVRGIPNERTHRKFFYYSLYCWLSPAVISAITAFIEFSPSIPEHFVRPQIKDRCWFNNDSLSIVAYFYGPIAVLLGMNVIMFMYTLYRIYQAQKDISTVIKNTNPEKQRFILYMKLLVLMGLPWIAEIISWIVGGPDYYWYLTDIINLLRAVFIFAVFCCKKQVLDELKRKIGLLRQPHVRRPSIPRTTSSFFDSTQSQDLPKYTNNAVSSL